MGFSRQEYWSELPSPPLEYLSDPGIEPAALMSPALAGEFFTTSATWEALSQVTPEKLDLIMPGLYVHISTVPFQKVLHPNGCHTCHILHVLLQRGLATLPPRDGV